MSFPPKQRRYWIAWALTETPAPEAHDRYLAYLGTVYLWADRSYLALGTNCHSYDRCSDHLKTSKDGDTSVRLFAYV